MVDDILHGEENFEEKTREDAQKQISASAHLACSVESMFCTHSRKMRQICKLAQTASARFSTYALPTPMNSAGSYQILQQEKDS